MQVSTCAFLLILGCSALSSRPSGPKTIPATKRSLAALAEEVEEVVRAYSSNVYNESIANDPSAPSIYDDRSKSNHIRYTIAFGVPSGAFALALIVILFRGRWASELLQGEAGRLSKANITDAGVLESSDGDGGTRYDYWVTYTFDGVRSDGMRCRVETERRFQRENMISTIGKELPVLYSTDDPGRCRLKEGVTQDFNLTHGCLGVTIFVVGIVYFFWFPFLDIFASDLSKHSIGTRFICYSLYAFGMTFGAYFLLPWLEYFFAFPFNYSRGGVTELGFLDKAEHIGDISGDWLIQIEHPAQRFEYAFSMVGATTVKIKGRQILDGKNEWGAESDGHFAEDGTELVFDDEDNSHFRISFDGPDSFKGFVYHDNHEGDKMNFEGSRKGTASVTR